MVLHDLRTENLSRLKDLLNEHDAGAMQPIRRSNTEAENRTKNPRLLAHLKDKGYAIAVIKAAHIEVHGTAATGVTEEIFIIIDHRDNGTLKEDLVKLGILHDQDAVLWMPNRDDAMLIGTTKRADSPYKATARFSGSEWGKAIGEFFFRVRGRPFASTEGVSISLTECQYPGTINGIRGLKLATAQIERELKEQLEEGGN